MEYGQNHEQTHPNSSGSPGFSPSFHNKNGSPCPNKNPGAGGGAPGSLATASEDTSLRVLNVSGLGKETHLGKFDHDRSLFSRSLESW